MKFRTHGLVFLLVITVLSGCSSKGGISAGGDDVAIEDRGTLAGEGAVSSGLGAGTDFGAGTSLESYLRANPDSPLARRVIYFEFDSAELSSMDLDLLSAHAAFLGANPDTSITLEGHTDARGTREYNIALGERRALSVQRVLELNGVPVGQMNTVSYGEEKPAADGNSEAAWRLNRRVEIIYMGM